MYDMYFDFSFYQQHVVNWAFSSLRSLTLGQDSQLRNHPVGSGKITVGCCFILVSTIWNYTQIYIMKHINIIAQTKSAGPTCSALWFSALSILSLCNVEWWEYDIEHISLCLTGWPRGQRKASGTGGKHLVHLILWQISLKIESMLAIYYSAGKEPCGTDWFQQLCPPASSIICFTNWQFLLNGRGHEYDVFN